MLNRKIVILVRCAKFYMFMVQIILFYRLYGSSPNKTFGIKERIQNLQGTFSMLYSGFQINEEMELKK